MLDEERKKGYKFVVEKNIARWFVFLLIGVLTALVACAIDISVEQLSKLKYKYLSNCILLININHFYLVRDSTLKQL